MQDACYVMLAKCIWQTVPTQSVCLVKGIMRMLLGKWEVVSLCSQQYGLWLYLDVLSSRQA